MHSMFAIHLNNKFFFFILEVFANIASYDRSNIDNIQLVLLCQDNDLNFFGFSKMLEILMNDILKLSVQKQIFLILGIFVVFVILQTENFNWIAQGDISCITNRHKISNLVQVNNSISRRLKGKSVLNTTSICNTSNPGLPPCIALYSREL